MPEIIRAIDAMLASLDHDHNTGGLLSRETIRKSDELRILVIRWKKENKNAETQ